MTPRGRRRVAAWVAIAACVGAGAGAGCRRKSEAQNELQLAARNRDAAPVVVVDRTDTSAAVGPLSPEKEPNDRRDHAQVVTLPGGIDGHLSSPDDIDFVRIDPKDDGMLKVVLSGPDKKAGGADLMLDLYDGDGKRVAHSDRGPAGTVEGLPDIGVSGGKTYYLSVSPYVHKHRRKRKGAPEEAPPDGKAGAYQLSVAQLSASPSEEVEPNDAIEGAREVLLADQVSGYLGWTKDLDLWKLSLAGFNGTGYALDLAIDGVDGVALEIEVVQPDGSVLVARKGQKGRGLLVRGLLPQAGTPYYVARVSGSRSNPEEPYRLRPTTRALDPEDETEPDDDEAHAIEAGPVSAGQQGTRRGTIDAGDMDLFRLEGGTAPALLAISVDPPRTVDAVLRILKPGGAELARSDNGKAGQREEVSGVALAPGQVVFVAVSGPALGDEPDRYTLTWSATGSAPPAPEPSQEPGPAPVDPYDN